MIFERGFENPRGEKEKKLLTKNEKFIKNMKNKLIWIIVGAVSTVTAMFFYMSRNSRVCDEDSRGDTLILRDHNDTLILRDNNDSLLANYMKNMNDIKKLTSEDLLWYLNGCSYSCPYGIEYAQTYYQLRAVDISMEIYEECMKRKGYRKPSEEIAKNRFIEIFGKDLASESNEVLYPLRLGRYMSPCAEEKERKRQMDAMEYTEEMESDFGLFWKSIIYDKERGFFVIHPDAVWLVEADGLDMSDEEGFSMKDGATITYNYSHSMLDFLLHENNYVFYGSKASFLWLKNNDVDFLINLCNVYGYDTVPEINELVIQHMVEYFNDGRMADNKLAYENVFFYHDLANNLHIREGLLNYVPSYYSQCSESEYIGIHNAFNSYKNDLVESLRGKIPDVFKNFSKEERMKMVAYIGYYYNEAERIESYDPFREELSENDELVEFIKNNDYFGLDSFPELVDRLIQDARSWRETEQVRANEQIDSQTANEETPELE